MPGAASPPPPSRPPPSSGIDHYLNHIWGKDSSELAQQAEAAAPPPFTQGEQPSRPEDGVVAPASTSPPAAPPPLTTTTKPPPEHDRPYAGFKNKAFKNRTEAWDLFREKLLEPIVRPDVKPEEWARRFTKGATFNNSKEMAEWILSSEDAERLPPDTKLTMANYIAAALKERMGACNSSSSASPEDCAESSKRDAAAFVDRLDDLAQVTSADIVTQAALSRQEKQPEVSQQRRAGLAGKID